MNQRIRPALAAVAAALAFVAAPAFAGKTLDAVKQRGSVKCGVTNGVAGFSAPDTQGNWSGLDVDTCRAIAAAVLGDGKKVEFVPLNSQQRFSALQAGEIDILARNTTWTLTRDASLGFHFTTITYYDGQGFLVPEEDQGDERQAAQERHHLHAGGHHQREERRRLLQGAEHPGQDGRVRELRGLVQGLLRRPLPGLHDRHLGARRPAQQGSAEPRRLRDPARADLQGAARAAGAPRRRRMVRHRQVGAQRADRGRGIRHHAGQHRRAQGHQQGPGAAAPARHRRRPRQAAGPGQGLVVPRDQGGGQLRRDLRAQRRAEVGAEAAARHRTTSGTRAG